MPDIASLEGLEELEQKLDMFIRCLEEELEAAVNWGVDLVVNEARMSDAFKDHTTNLRNSIIAEGAKWVQEQVTGIARAGMKYAAYVEFGTGPHGQATNTNTNVAVSYSPATVRFPRDAKALHWVNAQGEDVFRRSVEWQGTYAHPFMYPAFTMHREKITRRIMEAPARAARKAGLTA